MPVSTDYTIDYVDRKITYVGGFTGGIPDSIYTVNELYSYLQDTFDEPAQMDDPIPMTTQTPTQYTIFNKWFMDDETMKSLYGGSLQTNGWAYAASSGITQLWWTSGSSDPPIAADIGKNAIVGATSKTGVILAVDTVKRVVWIRNNGATQFVAADNVVEDGGGGDFDFVIEADSGAQTGVLSGESVWGNFFSLGNIQADTELYVGQEDEHQGGSTTPVVTKLGFWWDSDVDFATGSPNNVGGPGHFDILVKVQEAGVWLDDLNLTNQGRVQFYARQGDTVYSHFLTTGQVGNFPVPYAATGFDINQRGFSRVDIPGAFSGAFTIGEIITAPGGAKARLTSFVTDTSLSYILVGDLTDFTTGAELITGEDSGSTATKDGIAPTAINGAVAGGITVVDGHNGTFDVDQSGTNEDYAVVVDCNNLALSVVYEHLQYLARRGSTATLLPEPGAGNQDIEFYRGVGDIYITTDAEGTGLTEGQTVSGSISSATGELVAYDFGGGTGYCIITNVKGAFVNNDVITDEGAGSVTADVNQEVLVDVSAAPFGTFAGGRFFVARGVVLDNVPAGDNNNWQTFDVTGTPFQPPSTRTITFRGLVVNDRAAIFEVATPSGTDVVKTVDLLSGAVGSSTIVLDSNVVQDVPLTGWIRVVDTDTPGKEERYEYSSFTAATVTLRTVSPGDDVADGGTATNLQDTNVGLNFGQDGQAKVGHHIRNVTDSSEAVILRRVDDDNIETTALTGGTSNDWVASDAYEINTVAFLIDAADTCYFPYIDDTVESGTELAKSIKFDGVTEIVVRMRFSDPDVGGTRIIPFELLGQQITDADLIVTAIRSEDTIAS